MTLGMFNFDFKHDKTPGKMKNTSISKALKLLIIRLQLGCNSIIKLVQYLTVSDAQG
jgi:hypothetical protein